MADYQDLSEFKHGIIGTRDIENSISEVMMKFWFSRTIISRVYHEYRVSVKHQVSNIGKGGKRPWKNGIINNWRNTLSEIDEQQYLKLPWNSMLGTFTSVSVKCSTDHMYFRSQRFTPTCCLLLLTARHPKAYAWASAGPEMKSSVRNLGCCFDSIRNPLNNACQRWI